MTYGRSRYFFFDNAYPITEEATQARVGYDLESIEALWLVWDTATMKHKEYSAILKNRAEKLAVGLTVGKLLFEAWREYCEAKNL